VGNGNYGLVNPKLLLDGKSCVVRHLVHFEKHGMLFHENLETGPTPAGNTG
jgi:hypothetical protein